MKKIVKVTSIIMFSGLLSSCAAALVGGGAAGGYYVAKDKHAIGQYSDDAWITSKVKAQYLKDLTLKSLGISVSTNHGVVSLVGSVPSYVTKAHAVLIAAKTKGVTSVDAGNLTVNPKVK